MILEIEATIDEAFTFHRDDTGETFVFLTGKINREISTLGLTPHPTQIDAGRAAHVQKFNGVDQHRIARLDPAHRDLPILVADMEDGTQVIIDGNHRYVRRWLDGFDCIEAYWLPKTIWSRYLCHHT